MKALFLWLFALVPAIAASVPSPAPSIAPPATPTYFFTMDLDPRYQPVGTGALTEEDAAKAKCYRFAYDADGRVQQIEYRSAGVPMPDPLFGVTRIDFEREPGLERRWFHDGQGASVRDVSNTAGEELTLNAAGFPTAITNLNESGGKIRDNLGVVRYDRTLDAQNRLIAGRRIGLLGTNITDDAGYFETRTTYDLQGRVIERSNYDASENLLNNNDGIATVRTTTTLYPDATQTIKSYFDSSGLPAEEKSTGIHQRQQTYDQRGFLLDEAYFDSTGAPTLSTDSNVHELRYSYDERGNRLTEEFFDINGKPVELHNAGWYAKVAYKYDDKNRVVEFAYFGADGQPEIPLTIGAAIIRQEYDADGNIVRKQFFDGRGHPSRHAIYGADAIRISVDGDTTTITLRNGEDKPTHNPINGYYAFSYKTATDTPLSIHNTYYDRDGRKLSLLRVTIIDPHIHALRENSPMKWSAWLGVTGAGLGALLGCYLALVKSSHTKRRRVYVPRPINRFLGWLSVFAILEGTLRFMLTIYWAWVGYQNGRMGNSIYVLETIFICFFLYRLYRLSVTMRVLNITRDDLHRVVRDFFASVDLKPEWVESRNRYVTPPLVIRVNFFEGKNHGYLAFTSHGAEGRKLADQAARYLRRHARELQAPARTAAIALYYPSVAFCYFLLACTAAYTLYQMVKGY